MGRVALDEMGKQMEQKEIFDKVVGIIQPFVKDQDALASVY
jgi:hypothetical protein